MPPTCYRQSNSPEISGRHRIWVSISVPASGARNNRRLIPYQLYATNSTLISTYETITLQSELEFQRAFPWRLVAILHNQLGADFLAHYNLLPDMQRKRLIDGKTDMKAKWTASIMTTLSIKTVTTLPESAILAGYSKITRIIRHEAKHETIYCIKTTSGLPEACRSRRLAPDKLKGGGKTPPLCSS